MATLVLSPPKSALAIRIVSPEGEGPEGQKIRQATEHVIRHWNERIEYLLSSSLSGEGSSYDAIAPRQSFTVKVRYQHMGRGHPLAYPLGDDE